MKVKLRKPLTYKKAGVNIDRADDFVKKITPLIENTHNEGTLGTIGGFGGFFKADFPGVKNPVLVSAADGVGTKLLAAAIAKKFDTIGIDLVAMCVNDIAASGAMPLFFLDYFAAGKIKLAVAEDIMGGIVAGCKAAGCALIGGETAEMPDLYGNNSFDLAGFCVGVVGREDIIDGSKVMPGDKILGLASNGVHSNGFSLLRKIFSNSEIKSAYKKKLLKPTAIYVKPTLELVKNFSIKGIAHITGGGFYDNIPRALCRGTAASIDKNSWKIPNIFEVIKKRSKLSDEELYRTFNMGIGMAVIIEEKEIKPAIKLLEKSGIKSWNIGEVIKWAKKEVII